MSLYLREAVQAPSVVSELRIEEEAEIDGDRIVELFARLGERRAHRRLGATIEQIGTATGTLFRAVHQARFDEITRLAREIGVLAGDIGLVACVSVAHDLETCAARGDLAASAAVLNRLARLGASSARSCANPCLGSA